MHWYIRTTRICRIRRGSGPMKRSLAPRNPKCMGNSRECHESGPERDRRGLFRMDPRQFEFAAGAGRRTAAGNPRQIGKVWFQRRSSVLTQSQSEANTEHQTEQRHVEGSPDGAVAKNVEPLRLSSDGFSRCTSSDCQAKLTRASNLGRGVSIDLRMHATSMLGKVTWHDMVPRHVCLWRRSHDP